MSKNNNGSALRRSRRFDKSKISFFCTLCLPPLLLYILFCIYPIFSSLYTSFFEWSGYGTLSSDKFVGFGNYTAVITDKSFISAIKNDFEIILIKEILICFFTVLFAVSLTRLRFRKAERSIFRFIFFLPNVLSVIVISIMWSFVLDPYSGILNPLLKAIGLGRLIPAGGWTFDHPIGVVSFVASWCGIGLFMIIMIAAINSVSNELYESATIDGAGEWYIFLKIILPLCGPVIATLVIFQVVNQWNNFLWPLVVVSNPKKQVISVGLAMFNASETARYLGPRLAVSVLGAIPLMIVYLFLQKYIVQSVMLSGVKE